VTEKNQLKVIKTDSSIEVYLHNKVIGTINNALAAVNQADTRIAEKLSEAVTYFLYNKKNTHNVTSNEIFSIVKTVLATTSNEKAAIALNEHHYKRNRNRSRIEVVSANIQTLEDAEMLALQKVNNTNPWNKSIIVNDLINNYDLDKQTARTIAAMVEDKVLATKITLVPTSLIKQLLLNVTASLLKANNQLTSAQSIVD